jgi:prephenate dehydrogenase
MKKVAIFGVGLIGGSLGMALKAASRGYFVIGIGRDRTKLLLAKQRKAVDAFTLDAPQGVRDADIVVMGTPVNVIPSQVAAIAPYLKPGAVITDVGSVKGTVVKAVRQALGRKPGRPVFIGGHPLAGTEKAGVSFASPSLFKGASVVLTPAAGTPRQPIAVIQKMWQSAGANVLCMSPEKHDRIVALTSHFPHMLAFALSDAVGRLNAHNPHTARLIAGSFRDMTRIADSNPCDWSVICYNNREELIKTIDSFIYQLTKARKNLERRTGLERIFSAAKTARQKLLNTSSGRQ